MPGRATSANSLAKGIRPLPGPLASACGHAAAIRDGRQSSLSLTELYLRRIDRFHSLHAVVTGNGEDAVRTARECDEELARGSLRGPLHGVPVTVKESFAVAGLPTTANLRHLRNNVAASDAFVVRRLREAGAVILGKTNVPPLLTDYQCFGPLYPTANNPFDPERTPGGSTGGGAAAVAAGLTALEVGSDLAGSIRIPAHFCGVFGLKPTENATMHGAGHVPPLPGSRGAFLSMACVGPLARTMEDIGLVWNILNRPSWSYTAHLPARPARRAPLSQYRVAWFDEAGPFPCGSETGRVLTGFLRRLQQAGIHPEKRPFDHKWITEACEIWAVLLGLMVGQHANWLLRQAMKLQFTLSARNSALPIAKAFRTGMDLDFRAYSRILRRRNELIQELERRFAEYDFIVSPVAAGPAFPHNPRHKPIELEGSQIPYLDYSMPHSILYNACGNPALAIPAGTSPTTGLPIGLQIAAPHYAEDELIHFATQTQ